MKKRALFFYCLFIISSTVVPSIAVELSPVTVTSSVIRDDQELSPGSVTVIRPDNSKGELKTLPDILRQSVGVHITEIQGHGGYTVASIRGSTSDQVAVYIDGVLVNSGSESSVDLSTIPIENVDRIEIYRGHVPARFGVSGMGAVINIVTKGTDCDDNSLLAGVGSLGEKRLSTRSTFNTGSGKSLLTTEIGGYDGDFSFHNTRGTANAADDYEATRQFNSYTYEDILYKWQNDDWSFKANYYHKNRDVPYSARLNSYVIEGDPAYRNRRQDVSKKNISISRNVDFFDFNGNVYVFYSDQSKSFKDPGGVKRGNMPSWSDFSSSRIEGGLQGHRWLGDRHELGFYGSWAFEDHDVAGDGGYSIYQLEHYSRNELRLTLEDTYFPLKDSDLQIVPMVRYNKVGDESAWSWSTAVSYPLNENWLFKASYGHFFRAPNFYEIFGDGVYVIPNSSILPEEGDQWDLSVHWTGEIGEVQTNFGVTYFDSSTENLIVFVDKGPFQGKYENVNDASVKGVEVEIGANWDKNSLALGYTYMDSCNKALDAQYHGKPLPNRPENVWHLRLERQFSQRFMAYLEGSYTSDNYLDLLGDVVWSDYSKIDIGAKWQLKNGPLLAFGVRDLFDTTVNVHSYGDTKPGVALIPDYPMEGRTFHMSLLWSF